MRSADGSLPRHGHSGAGIHESAPNAAARRDAGARRNAAACFGANSPANGRAFLKQG